MNKMYTIKIVRNFRNLIVSRQIRFYTNATGASLSNSNENQKSSNEIKPSKFYDIVICGGGMVGLAMVAALGKNELFQNHKIALIESASERNDYKLPQYHSNRVSALNQSSVDLLKSSSSY